MNSKDVSQVSKVVGTTCYVGSKPWILSRTVKDNICLGEDQNDLEKLNKCIELAGMTRDVKLLDEGIDTICLERGENLSGGQRTRLEIARCFYLDRDIFLLDDPLKSLDPNTSEKIISQSLSQHFKEKTIIMTSSNVPHAEYADTVYILESGKIVFKGSYAEAQQEDSYQKLLNENKEEDENLELKIKSLADNDTSKKQEKPYKLSNLTKSDIMLNEELTYNNKMDINIYKLK